MAFSWNLPERLKYALLYQGVANGVTCDVVSMKTLHKGWFLITHTGSTDVDLTLTLMEATDVAAGTNAAITTVCPIWVDLDAGTTSDVVSKTTSAYAYTIDTGVAPSQVVMIEIDPAILSDGYDCVYLADSGGSGSNYCTIQFFGAPRYTGAELAAIITD